MTQHDSKPSSVAETGRPLDTHAADSVRVKGHSPDIIHQTLPSWPCDIDSLPMLLCQKHLAALFGVSERKLERDRHNGEGVRFTKIGRRVLYRKDDVLAYLDQSTYQSTAEAKAKVAR